LLHAKHSYMPNQLGYCGPDSAGELLAHLEDSSISQRMIRELMKFEAAFPYIRLIAASTGKEPFEYEVPEAYWIGNPLLDTVKTNEFYEFSHSTITKRERASVKKLFQLAGQRVVPHHSFHVISTFLPYISKDGPDLQNESTRKILQQVENCRISWGKVIEVRKRELVVERVPLEISERRFSVSSPRPSIVKYDPLVKPFDVVKPGDNVSLHWGFACEILTRGQLENLIRYTLLDIRTVNDMLARLKR